MTATSSSSSPALRDEAENGWSLALLDPTIPPDADFYEHATRRWRTRHPIPDDRSRWGTFDELHRRNLERIVSLLEEAAHAGPDADPLYRALGRYYRHGIEPAPDLREGLRAITALRSAIRGLASSHDASHVVARLHGLGIDVLFTLGAQPHPLESERHIAVLWQSGLGLPDREYYLRTETPYQRIREAYQSYLSRLLVDTDTVSAADSREAATRILHFETELARLQTAREVLRDPQRTFHPHRPAELPALWAPWPWSHYLEQRGLTSLPEPVNVGQTDYFHGLVGLLARTDIDTLALYLEGRLLDATAPHIDEGLAQARFEYTRVLTGQPQLRRRPERVALMIEATAGFAIGRFYCARHVPPHDKARVEAMFRALRQTLDERLARLDWLSPSTRQEAQDKLARMRAKLAYPERWRDMSGLHFEDEDYLANILEGLRHEVDYETGKIGKPVDPDEWEMTPQTVNAYYNPPQNEIVFPAGILDRPFFDPEAPDAYNYGALGAVIGHEMLHGFDDQGRKYDARGNLRDWWTEDDQRRFREAAADLGRRLAAFPLRDGLRLNPELVLGEALADVGGLDLAWEAWRRYGSHDEGSGRYAGIPSERLFFYAFAYLWAGDIRPEALRLQIDTDPHPPAEVRVNLTTRLLPSFRQVFGASGGNGDSEGTFTLWSGGETA